MNFTRSTILIFLICISISWETFAQAHLFGKREFVGANNDTLRYRQLDFDYSEGSKYPLVIFLHGAGERGNGNEAQLRWGVTNFANDDIMKVHRPIVIAPQCPREQAWGNYGGFRDGKITIKKEPTTQMKLLKQLIDQMITEYPIDTDRIYITGLSMGGFGTFDALARYPDLFAAAVPVCGGGDVSTAKNFAHVPMWIFHGALDQVVEPKLSREMLEALIAAGAHPGYTEYPDTGHFSWIATYSDPMMMDWLFSQRKE